MIGAQLLAVAAALLLGAAPSRAEIIGRPIYYSICPHRPMTSTFPGEGFAGVPKEWATDIAYSPPPEWSRAERHALHQHVRQLV